MIKPYVKKYFLSVETIVNIFFPQVKKIFLSNGWAIISIKILCVFIYTAFHAEVSYGNFSLTTDL